MSTKNVAKNSKTGNRPNSTDTYIKYNNNAQNIKSKAYTHIFVDPEDIIKQHMKERINNKKTEEQEIANYTKKTITNFKQNITNTANLEILNEKEKSLIPLANSNLEDFQMKIINYIVNNRIFKQKDMDNLLNQLLIKNKNVITEEEIRNIFSHVIEELDK